MKFTKLAKSDKFEYMMLSRLIQDAKYFIDYPDLKHLWAKTLDEHIKQMKEQYAKLDPKPEWTSEEEINSLAKQMKESYKNYWNEVHPDNKIEAAIQQPNKPKPTTMLPDNMQWAWDPEAADWVAVLKDNTNTTPPLYDPNNQNVVNQTTSYMSTVKSSSNLIDVTIKFDNGDIIETNVNGNRTDEQIKEYYKVGKTFNLGSGENDNLARVVDVIIDRSMQKQSSCLAKFLDGPQYSKEIKIEAGLIKEGLVKYAGFDFNRGTKYAITTKGLEVLRRASEAEHNEALNEREKLAYMFGFNTDEISTLDTTGKVIKSDELSKCEWCGEEFDESELEDTELGKVCYRCKKGIESKGGPMNNKNISEAKQYLEKYLLENPELFKYQYGKDNVEEVLKELIEENPNWYKKFSSKKWTIYESDGTPLGKVTASSELDAKVKFGIEHPEYAESLSICAKEVKAGLEYGGSFEYNDYKIDLFNDTDGGATFVIYAPKGKTVNHESMYKGTASTMDEAITKAYNIIDGSKEINAQYEQTTESHEPYPNPSETPNDHIILENHDGWVNTASFEDDIRKQFQQPHQKLPNSDRDLALLEKQILEITDEDTRDTIKKIFDEFQFSDKEAAEKRPYTEEEKRLLPLFKLLNQHVAKKEIQLVEDPQKDGNIVATGQAEVINDLEHEVKDLGFHCEPIAEITDEDYIGYDIYSLRIFTK